MLVRVGVLEGARRKMSEGERKIVKKQRLSLLPRGEINRGVYFLQRIFNRTRELEKRRVLRASMTVEEKIIWEKLRNRKLNGYKFKRQYSIGPYVVDFYCSAKKLAIEIDGKIHETGTAKEYDKEREDFIKSFGIKVIRFNNETVEK